MKRMITAALSAMLVLSLAACGSSVKPAQTSSKTESSTSAAGTGSTKESSTSAAAREQAKEGSVSDIAADKVMKFVTDEIELPEDSMYRSDYASSSYYAVYDFSTADEIKSYTAVYNTDPAAHDDTKRIMEDTGCNPVFSDNNKTVSVERSLGISNNVQDIIEKLDKNKNSFTAYMKDGSELHVAY